jgi:acetyl-CoA carboxylase biotin carboxylase subunit
VGGSPLFSRVLVANRGEIAIRVFRTCHELGIDTVAVYSDADRTAPHVAAANHARWIGPAPARESYLVVERILDAARESGAEAIHPGYGFLAENPEFAEAVQAAGLTWIGPPPEAMRLLGDKTAARKIATENSVPVIPGTPHALTSDEEASAAAQEIGYPVLLKAAAGGGGKGMRVVEGPGDLESALRSSRSEAQSAFGKDTVFIEKYLPGPRHVEIQIIADCHGNCVWLGERECSVQRRHQKIIEETPSPALTAEMREAMGEAAVRLGRAAGYTNAGTVEFLLDNEEFFFLEVNTRLQVEHPVTEMVTGRDLVRDQLLVAAGNPLDYQQADVLPDGAAIEVRIYAEDPDNNFYPSPGTIEFLQGSSGPGVRHDCGVAEGTEVTLHYDPLIAKLIAWGPHRDAALRRIHRALEEYQIAGVTTILPFLREILTYGPFVSGDYDTHIVQRMMSEGADSEESPADSVPLDQEEEYTMIAAVAAALFHTVRPRGYMGGADNSWRGGTPSSPWLREGRRLRRWQR